MGRRRPVPQRERIEARPQIAERTVKSAGRVLEILEFFDDIQRRSTVMEVAEALGYPQSSTSALLRSLVSLGYLNYDRNARTYVTSSRVALLGSWVNSPFFAEGKIISLMKEASERTGDTILLATRHGLQVQYIHVIQATSLARLHMTLGTVRSIASSGAGYAMLGTMNDIEVRRIAMRINAEAAEGEPLINIRDLIETIGEVRRLGYAFTCDLVTRGGGIIAAPLPQMVDQPRMILGIGGISEVMRPRREELGATLLELIDKHFGDRAVNLLPFPQGRPATPIPEATP